MNIKDELNISITKAESLKKITKMPGWKIIEEHIEKSEEKCYNILKNIENKDIIDIQGTRYLLNWIKDFRDLLKYTELSAEEDSKELSILKNERRIISNGKRQHT